MHSSQASTNSPSMIETAEDLDQSTTAEVMSTEEQGLDILPESKDIHRVQTIHGGNLTDLVAASDVEEGLFSGADEGTDSDVDVVGDYTDDDEMEETAVQPEKSALDFCEDCKFLRDTFKVKGCEINFKDEFFPKFGRFPKMCTIM